MRPSSGSSVTTVCLPRSIERIGNYCNTTAGTFATADLKPIMESLLSLSFDYLSSFDGVKIKKGLRQLEGLLAQICLSKPSPSPAAERRRSVALNGAADQSTKELSSLRDDPAFREFFKLQEGFQWNVATRLVACLERLLGKGSSMFDGLE